MRSQRTVGFVLAIGVVVAPVMVGGCAAGSGASSGPTIGAPSAAPSAAATAATANIPHGSWTVTTTAEDLRDAGFTDPGAAAENTGTFTLTLAPDGTWTIAQATSQPVKWPVFRGSYTETGEDTIEMLTTFPPEYAGDLVSARLTEVADGLAIELLSPDDPLLRFQLEGQVWAPSR